MIVIPATRIGQFRSISLGLVAPFMSQSPESLRQLPIDIGVRKRSSRHTSEVNPGWSAYDDDADMFATVAEPLYFVAPAADLVSLLKVGTEARLLDLGAGSGAVTVAAKSTFPASAVVACDPALSLLLIARRRTPVAKFTAARMPNLPFRPRSFDGIALAFVLSHVFEIRAALEDINTMLDVGGQIVMSSWANSSAASGPGKLWQATAERFIDSRELSNAVTEVLPWESQLATPEGVHEVLVEAGFRNVQVQQREYPMRMSTHEYLTSRMLSIPARYMRAHLTASMWEQFRNAASEALTSAFGTQLQFVSVVNFTTARRAG